MEISNRSENRSAVQYKSRENQANYQTDTSISIFDAVLIAIMKWNQL